MPTEPLAPQPPPSTSYEGRHTQTGHRGDIPPMAPTSLPVPPALVPHGVGEGASPPLSRVAGERNPVAVATVSKRTGGCSRPARAPSLTGVLLPSLPPTNVGWGRVYPRPGQGSGAETTSQGAKLPAGEAQPWDYLPPSLQACPTRNRRGTHGPRHPPRARTPALGRVAQPSGRTPRPVGGDGGSSGGGPRKQTVAAKAARSAGLAARGARTAAYTARASPACARAAASRGPPPPATSRRGGCPERKRGAWDVGRSAHLPRPDPVHKGAKFTASGHPAQGMHRPHTSWR